MSTFFDISFFRFIDMFFIFWFLVGGLIQGFFADIFSDEVNECLMIISICIIFKMNNNQEQNQGGINCSEFIGKIPFWTRTVYFGLSAFWLLDLITNLSSTLIAASLKSSLYNLYFWTFLTSCFYIHSLFFLTIVIYNFHTFLPKIVPIS